MRFCKVSVITLYAGKIYLAFLSGNTSQIIEVLCERNENSEVLQNSGICRTAPRVLGY